jgi:hypothetical protein
MNNITGKKQNRLHLMLITVLLLLATSACLWTFTLPNGSGQAADQAQILAGTPEPALVTEVASQATHISSLATDIMRMEAELEKQMGLITYLATRGPAVPPTPPAATPHHPLQGGLELEGGKCCVGGAAGETTTVQVEFFAESPFSEITAMRVSAGANPQPPQVFEQLPWQPFTSTISFEVPITINWTGFYVQVQFRDGLGNLSPVYVDDISVEGMPAPLTPTP